MQLDLFQPDAATALARTPGISTLGLSLGRVAGETTVGVLEALRGLELVVRERPVDEVRAALIATLPGGSRNIPDTRTAARSVLQLARREILVVGFSITDDEFCRQLIDRALAGVHVCVVSDRVQGGARALLRTWPAQAKPLVALENVEPETVGQMHGKTIVADRHTALIGSANFTAGGFRNNFEFGVRLEGDLANQICQLVERLHRERWLVEVHP